MNPLDSLGGIRPSAAPRRDNAAAVRDRDERIEGMLQAIRVAGGDREAAISACHRALARAVTTK